MKIRVEQQYGSSQFWHRVSDIFVMSPRAGINRRHDQSPLRKCRLVAGGFDMAEREQSLSRHTTHAVTGLSANLIKTKSLKNFVAAGAAALLLLGATPVWAADAAVKIGNFTFGPQELKVKSGHHDHLDQRGRHAAHGGVAQQLPVQGARY